jgi:hypothetical protein
MKAYFVVCGMKLMQNEGMFLDKKSELGAV